MSLIGLGPRTAGHPKETDEELYSKYYSKFKQDSRGTTGSLAANIPRFYSKVSQSIIMFSVYMFLCSHLVKGMYWSSSSERKRGKLREIIDEE